MGQKDGVLIQITEDQFQNIETLKAFFESLYLGPSKSYTLVFSQEFQKQVDIIFDQLILEHGILPVFFGYQRLNLPKPKDFT